MFRSLCCGQYLAALGSDAILNHPSLEGAHDEDISLTAHDRHIGRTFLVSYQHLDATVPTDALALALLARTACLASGEQIPLDLLLTTADLDVEDPQGHLALQRLLNLSLLTSESTQTVQIHRLVHAFVQGVIEDTTALDDVEQVVGKQATEINNTGYPSAMYSLLPHLRWMTRLNAMCEDIGMATLCTTLANHLEATGDYAGARPLMERALTINEQVLGPDHPDTADSLNNLALLLGITGDYNRARPLMERALAINEQALGPDHPHTARSLNNLAGLLETIGDAATAWILYERALVIRKRILGPDHPITATTVGNLARMFEATGDYAGARPLYERTLAINEQAFGPNHPTTAKSLNNLAGLLQTIGDYAGAQPLYQRALAIWEQVLGPDHPTTAISLNNLAMLLQAIGDYAGARPLLERALAIWEQALGPDHPTTAISLNNLAMLLQAIGDYAGAQPRYERALAIWEQSLGLNHSDTARSLNNLATLLEAMGDYSGAQPLYERARAIQQQVLGPTHSDTAMIRRSLARELELNQRHDRRIPYTDFEIAIGASVNDTSLVQVRTASGFQDTSTLILPTADPRYTNFLTKVENNITLVTEDDVLDLGVLLYEALFRGKVWGAFVAARDDAARDGKVVRIKLSIAPDQVTVAAFPWEFVCDDTGIPLATEHPFCRFLPRFNPFSTLRFASGARLKLLLTSALPTELDEPFPLDIDGEIAAIRTLLKPLEEQGVLTVVELPHLTGRKLQKAIENEQPHVIHYVGHTVFENGVGSLVLENPNGSRKNMPVDVLVDNLCASSVRLLLLNACLTGTAELNPLRGIAPAVLDAIPAVVAMPSSVGNEAGRAFAEEFYRTLAAGDVIDGCVAAGRKAVIFCGLNNPDWGLTTLYMCTPDGVLFEGLGD